MYLKTSIKSALLLGLFFVSSHVSAATLSVSPNTGVYTVGSPFTARIILNTQGQAVNAAEGTLSFNPKELRVQSVSQGGSIFNLWAVEPSYSNSVGTITFGGGSPKGYTGSSGTIITIQFVPQGAGTAKVTFNSGSALAADGSGTNVLTSMGSGTFTIAAQSATPEPEVIEYVAPANTPGTPSVESTTHPDPESWYANTTAELRWVVPADVTAVRTALTDSPGSVPTVVYEPPISNKSLANLEQGEQYFHVQFKNENGWGRVAHYRLGVDSEKPTAFTISMLDAQAEGNPRPTLKFDVVDATSEVRKFIIQIDADERVEYFDETGSSTYQLPPLEPGRHSVVVEAFDEAGNSIVSNFAFDIASFEKPIFTEFPARISADVIPVIIGSTRPNADVFITITMVGSSVTPQEYKVVSNAEGSFTFIPDGAFAEGVYEFTAYSIDQFGAQSESSDSMRMVVAPAGYIQLGTMLISALSLFIPLVGLLFLLIFGTIYMVTRVRRISGYVTRETKEAETSVVQAFGKLRTTLDTHATTLAASRKTKQLTKAEGDLVEALRNELQAAERRVKKEVSDVDDIV